MAWIALKEEFTFTFHCTMAEFSLVKISICERQNARLAKVAVDPALCLLRQYQDEKS